MQPVTGPDNGFQPGLGEMPFDHRPVLVPQVVGEPAANEQTRLLDTPAADIRKTGDVVDMRPDGRPVDLPD